jgi:hypothetical protein
MWHLVVIFGVSSDHTFGKAQGGNFPTHAMCAQVGQDFLKHFPHTVSFHCVKR